MCDTFISVVSEKKKWKLRVKQFKEEEKKKRDKKRWGGGGGGEEKSVHWAHHISMGLNQSESAAQVCITVIIIIN